MRKHWLLFTQAVTILLALLFIIQTLKPELLPNVAKSSGVVTLYESVPDNSGGGQALTNLNQAAQKAMPAVVNIFTRTEVRANNPFMDDPRFRFFFGEQGESDSPSNSSLGSGVIVSSAGYILTNHHVIESADKIEVALADGRKAQARIVGSDPETDLAVIKIDLPGTLPIITFGQSEKVHVGDIVLAIGNPFGVGETVTMGIVSALKRDHLGLNTFENFIQTDAAINPGNSGGALVDAQGNLIGVNSAIYSPNGGSLGIGFAIPVSTAKKTMEQIIQHGSVTRGWLGAAMQEITPELARSFGLSSENGVLISDVMRDGPADQAGVRRGDVLVSIDQRPVSSPRSMLDVVANIQPGQVVLVELVRKGAPMSFKVKVGKRPPPQSQR